MDDARIQRLVTLLTEYKDVVVPNGPFRHNAIEFWLNNKRIIHQFDSQNSEAHLRAALRDLGAQPKPQSLEAAAAFATESTSEESTETTSGESGEASTMASNELPNVEPDAEPELSNVAEEVPDTAPEVPPIPVPPIPNVQPGQSTVHRINEATTTVYRSSRVIAIEMEKDLTIPKGHMLVIPLNRPNTLIDMAKEQFEVLFDATESAEIADVVMPDSVPLADPPTALHEEPPIPRQQFRTATPPTSAPRQARKVANEENFENDILTYLKQRRGAVKARVIAKEIGRPIYRTEVHLRALLVHGIVECPQTGFWAIVKTATPNPAKPKPVTVTGKVPPQLTRILAAMAFAAKTTGRPDLTSRDVTPHLPERDARQYGARMPGAVDKGLVERGLPLPDARGSHHRLTSLGLAAVKDQATFAYENEGLPVPAWLVHL